MVGVNDRYVQDAQLLQKKNKQLLDKVFRGDILLYKAVKKYKPKTNKGRPPKNNFQRAADAVEDLQQLLKGERDLLDLLMPLRSAVAVRVLREKDAEPGSVSSKKTTKQNSATVRAKKPRVKRSPTKKAARKSGQ